MIVRVRESKRRRGRRGRQVRQRQIREKEGSDMRQVRDSLCVCVSYLCKQRHWGSFSFLFIQVLLPGPRPPLYTHCAHTHTHTVVTW